MPHKDKEKRRIYRNKYYKRNAEKLRIYDKEHYKLNKEAHTRSNRKYRRSHKDMCRKACKKYYAAHREQRRDYELRRTVGITLKQYNSILAAQNGRCAICAERGIKTLGIDHNHKTGQVRGILCDRCNIAIGLLKIDESGLKFVYKLADYIKKFS